MKLNTYDQVLKDAVSSDVQSRFVEEIRRMRALGFNDEFYLRETVFPFSALLFFPILIYMHIVGERIRVGGLLQAMSFNPFLIHEQSYAYGTTLKLGVKFTSMFDDGTLLITTSFDNGVKSNPANRLVRQSSLVGGIAGAWKKHTWYVGRLADQGLAVIAPLGMKDVIRMEQRSDSLSMGLIPDDLKEKLKNQAE